MTFATDGFEFLENFVAQDLLEPIKADLETIPAHELKAGIRNADKKLASVNQLVNAPHLFSQAAGYLGARVNLVRVILFNKTPANNWLVSWHQDKTLCVPEKFAMEGWGPWSIKDGNHHVQPPLAVLNQMVTFRIHIDESNVENGCLRIIPTSHTHGILTPEKIQIISNCIQPINCIARPGTILVMKPHILHASSKAANPGHRRIIHAEYSSYKLPFCLQWV